MLDQINNAFAELDEKMHVAAIEFTKEKKANFQKEYMKKQNEYRDLISKGEMKGDRIYGAMFYWTVNYYGSKAMMNLIDGHGLQDALENVEKNVQAKIDRRNAQIMRALRKKEVNEIPEFKLVEYSNGVEGFFDVAGHKVHIRTILAGGYNIQCLHARTLVNIS